MFISIQMNLFGVKNSNLQKEPKLIIDYISHGLTHIYL